MTKARNIANIASDGSALADGTINYTDVTGTPTLAAVATSGSFTDLSNQPAPFDPATLATVAVSGSFNDLSNQPSPFDPNTLATVATTGAYADVTGTPTLGTAAATNTTAYATAAQGTLADSATQPGDLAAVATTGAYGNLSGTPTLGTAAATNATAYATAAQGTLADTATQPGDLAAVATSGAYSSLSGVPALAAVATSGSYSSLSGTPAIPAPAHNPVSVSGTTQALNVGSYNFFNGGSLTGNTTLSFTNVPTNALWTYTCQVGVVSSYVLSGAFYTGNNYQPSPAAGQGLHFKPDGSKMYVLAARILYEYDLSSPFVLSSAILLRSQDYGAQESGPQGFTFSTDGSKIYIVGHQDSVYQYNLSTAWNVTTGTYSGLSTYVGSQTPYPNSCRFNPTGTKMYVVGFFNSYMHEYTLSTAWAVNTASNTANYNMTSGVIGYPQDLAFNSNGTKVYVIGSQYAQIKEFSMSTPYSASTMSPTGVVLNVLTQENSPRGLFFKTDGVSLFVLGVQQNKVFEYLTGTLTSLTFPASLANTPTSSFTLPDAQASYTFFTANSGTTVKLVNEEIMA